MNKPVVSARGERFSLHLIRAALVGIPALVWSPNENLLLSKAFLFAVLTLGALFFYRASMAASPESHWALPTPLHTLFLLAIVTAVSAWRSPAPFQSFFGHWSDQDGWCELALGVLFLFLLLQHCLIESRMSRLSGLLLATGTVAAVVTSAGRWAGVSVWGRFIPGPASWMGSETCFAVWMALLLPLGFSRLLMKNGLSGRLISLVGLLILWWGILTLQSLVGVAAAGAGLAAWAFFVKTKETEKILIWFFLFLGLAVVLWGLSDSLAPNAQSWTRILAPWLEPSSVPVARKLFLWQTAWALLRSHPLWGAGPACFDLALLPRFSTPLAAFFPQSGFPPQDASSSALTFIAETGLLGALALFLAVFSLVRFFFRLRGELLTSLPSLHLTGFAASLCAFAVGFVLTEVSFPLLTMGAAVVGLFLSHEAVFLGRSLVKSSGPPNSLAARMPETVLLLALWGFGVFMGGSLWLEDFSFSRSLSSARASPQTAIARLQKMLSSDHLWPIYPMTLGRVSMEAGEWKRAEEAYHYSVKHYPTLPFSYLPLAEAQRRQGKVLEAEYSLSQAKALNPADPKIAGFTRVLQSPAPRPSKPPMKKRKH